mmetsp:Transcript_8849/g.15014  ORF Transcript_8849/g.15014 Transcript_8849/m.15014 type:complete len:90 (+) Transcript_8849:2509-2778(+)
MRGVFADPGIVKILHGCDTDIKLLISDLHIVTINLFDTARAFTYIECMPPSAKSLELKQFQEQRKQQVNSLSLQKLCKLLLNVDLDKYF